MSTNNGMTNAQARDEIYSYAGIIREYRRSLDFDAVANALRKIADGIDVSPLNGELIAALDALLPYATNMLEADHPVVARARTALKLAMGDEG